MTPEEIKEAIRLAVEWIDLSIRHGIVGSGGESVRRELESTLAAVSELAADRDKMRGVLTEIAERTDRQFYGLNKAEVGRINALVKEVLSHGNE